MLSYAEDESDYDYENNVAKKVKWLPKKRVKTVEEMSCFLRFTSVYIRIHRFP